MCCEQVLEIEHPIAAGAVRAQAHLDLDPVPRSVPRARQWLREQLAGQQPELLEAMALLATELVTNAVLHARTPLAVGFVLTDDEVVVAVADHNRAMPLARAPQTERTDGRGIGIVEMLSTAWGTAVSVSGKTVWFALARGGAAAKGAVRVAVDG